MATTPGHARGPGGASASMRGRASQKPSRPSSSYSQTNSDIAATAESQVMSAPYSI
jgi:hypothetical protein